MGLIIEADHGVRHLRGVGAGAAGELRHDLMEVPLQELAFTIEPLLTAVHIFRKEGEKIGFKVILKFLF